ncbi:MAG: dihydropteroate synthase [Desulfobacteria bacterium]|jgi:dihydropteroate synthase|nr:MAG: dihydropteroate synthase [Desulfobacterales bacterium C00003106]
MLLRELLGENRTLLMGILNVTPDSFSDGGMFVTIDKAVAHGEALCSAGADIIDVGGVSTRPFADPVSVDEEIARVIPVIKRLSQRVSAPISVDTSRAETAERAIEAGARIVNDIAALRFDPLLGDVVAEADLPVVLMHMQGTPETMQIRPAYDDVMGEIIDFLSGSIDLAVSKGIPRENIIVDPGIGFGKKVEHNLTIIRELSRLKSLGRPILVGASRKSFIGEVTGIKEPARRDTATLAVTALLVASGADIIRVHDVKRSTEVVRMVEGITDFPDRFS